MNKKVILLITTIFTIAKILPSDASEESLPFEVSDVNFDVLTSEEYAIGQKAITQGLTNIGTDGSTTHQEIKRYKCDHENCSYASAHSGDLKKHKVIHTGEKPHKCKYPGCRESFSRNSNLNRHQKTHNQKKIYYRCDYPGCSKAFFQKDGLTRHQKTHVAIKNTYKCEYCSKDFAYISTLKRHNRIHTREKPYKCDHQGCLYASTRNEDLKRHERTHTGERPYRCEHCNKGFADIGNLKRHKNIHTKQLAKAVALLPDSLFND